MSEWKELSYRGTVIHRLEISDEGEIRNKKTGKILKQQISKKGYCNVTTTNDNAKLINVRIHCAVAENFIPNPDNLPQVNHKDGNKQNCRADNLEWITNRDNVLHAMENGLYNPYSNPKSKHVKSVEDDCEYESIGRAGEAYSDKSTSSEVARKNISRALATHGTAYGMTWVYVD